jgi:hypothetical protein
MGQRRDDRLEGTFRRNANSPARTHARYRDDISGHRSVGVFASDYSGDRFSTSLIASG